MAVSFDAELLNCIADGLNDQATLMLVPDLAKASDGFGTLLHHAALYNNQGIIQRLMDLGAEVDAVHRMCGCTPLMLAVHRRHPSIVRVLLEAGASIDAVDANGRSALRMAFNPREPMCADTIKLLFDRARAAAPTREKLVQRLLQAGFTLNNVVCTGDVELLQELLNRADIAVDSRGYYQRTALLDTACKANDVGMARILCDRGADVNALDKMSNSALVYSALRGNADLVQLLLDRGADPNSVNLYGMDPLHALLANAHIEDAAKADRCVELLLRRGARIGRSRYESLVYLNEAMSNHSPALVEILVAHLTMLGKFDASDTLGLVSRAISERKLHWFAKCVLYHDACEEILGVRVFRATTLADLLLEQSERKTRLLVRNERFMSYFENFCSKYKLQDRFSYYYNTTRERITKTKHTVELEDKAVPVVSDILNSSYNQCYIVARKILEYLQGSDLEQLCQV